MPADSAPAPITSSRRRALLAALLAGGCATAGRVTRPGSAGEAADGFRAGDGPGAVVEVASGVYMVRGAPGEVDATNLGRVGNAGFIVGGQGVVAVDTGTSYLHGQALLSAIAGVTDRPVLRVVVTHARQEFLFGANAFRARGIPVHMQRDAAGLMAARCRTCLERLRRTLGPDAMRGTEMFTPDVEFDGTHVFTGAGRPVRVLVFGHSSGPGDTAVLDEATGTLFAGGLLDRHRVPDLHDADPAGWRRALDALRALAPRVVVPGHGPAAPPGVIDEVAGYIDRTEARVRALLREGVGLGDVAARAALPEYAGWDGHDTIHRRNAVAVFLRLERDWMSEPPR